MTNDVLNLTTSKRAGFRKTEKFLIEKHGENFLKVFDALVAHQALYQVGILNDEEYIVKLSYDNLSQDTGLSIDALELQINDLERLDFITLINLTQRNLMLYFLNFNHIYKYIRAVEFEMEDEFDKWNSWYNVVEFYSDLFNDCKGDSNYLTEDIIFNKVFDSRDHKGDFIYLVDYGVKMYKKDYFEIIENYSPAVMQLINFHVYCDFEEFNLTYPYYKTMKLTYEVENEKLDLNDSNFEVPLLDISKDELIICIHNKIVTAIKESKI